jgi:hypothetical protein
MLVHLEGNIASGKSTLGQSLAAHPRFHFIPEPVEVWQTGFADNVLDRFYSDMGRWSFTFQVCTFATRVAALRDRPDGRISVAERSIGCDRYVFALSLYEQGALDAVEWEIYRRLWEEMAPKAPARTRSCTCARPPRSVCAGSRRATAPRRAASRWTTCGRWRRVTTPGCWTCRRWSCWTAPGAGLPTTCWTGWKKSNDEF